jgi:hypothetical protein
VIKQPVITGVVAFLYIIGVVSVMNLGSEAMSQPNDFVASIAIISLFTLSAAVMGYLFVFQPVHLYLADKKEEAISYFLHSVLTFGALTAVILVLMFFGVLS